MREVSLEVQPALVSAGDSHQTVSISTYLPASKDEVVVTDVRQLHPLMQVRGIFLHLLVVYDAFSLIIRIHGSVIRPLCRFSTRTR